MVYLLLGSNLGNRLQLLQQATDSISRQIGKIEKTSAVYESEAWGFECPQNFLNQVVAVSTPLTAVEVLAAIQQIEKEAGRIRTGNGYQARTLDIDILFYHNQVINLPELTIPHPQLHLRKFTLEPLCEIAPDMIHPVLKRTMRELLHECPDKGKVWLFSE